MRKNRTLAWLILALFVATAFTIYFTPVEGARNDPIEITDIIEDGDVTFDDPGYTRDNSDTIVDSYVAPDRRGYIEFNISTVGYGAVITKVELRFRTENSAEDPEFYEMTSQPSASADSVVYADAGDGDKYLDLENLATTTWYTYDLGSDAVTDLQSQVDANATWFAVGIVGQGTSGTYIESEESSNDPILYIYYYFSSDYEYIFSGHYYENGNVSGAINVTAYFPTNETEIFLVNGSTSTTMHFQEYPILFTFPVDSDTRRLYGTGAEENFTVFSPEDEHVNYEFSVIDYTGKLSDGAYLEAYRTVNGTEELIERMIIYDQINTVPMALVVGSTYHIKVLWEDGTSYDWGYWPAGSDPTPTIVLYRLNFSQKAQLTYKYINVEATRPNATHIRLNYEDNTPEGYETTWCNITVTYRNETTVTTYNSSSESFSWNWYVADNETDYWVLVEIVHTFFNNREYSQLLDAPDESYSSFLNLDVLGTLGGLNTANTFSAVIVLCVFGVGSRKNVDVALIAGFSVAGMLRLIGANTWSYNLLAFGFALSIAYAVYRGRVKP